MSSNGLMVLSQKLAERFGMGNDADVLSVLKGTAFKAPASDAQLTALMIVAQQYDLNPFTKEIYAFPDKNNGIVPVVGVDGWSRIINNHPQFDGMDFEQDDEKCTCIIHRKDRSHPIRITEYMAECRRQGIGPWTSHPKRMLRHKAMIQCARVAFGYGGIYDQDEAERISEGGEKFMGPADVVGAQPTAAAPKPTVAWTDEEFTAAMPAWQKAINLGKTTPQGILEAVALRNPDSHLTEAQKARILSLKKQDSATDVTPKTKPAEGLGEKSVQSAIDAANDEDALNNAAAQITLVPDADARKRLEAAYDRRLVEIKEGVN